MTFAVFSTFEGKPLAVSYVVCMARSVRHDVPWLLHFPRFAVDTRKLILKSYGVTTGVIFA